MCRLQASTELVASMAKGIRRKPLGALTPGYRIANDLQNLLDRLLPPNAHEIARGKLHVSLTDVKTKQNEVVSEFASRQELIQVRFTRTDPTRTLKDPLDHVRTRWSCGNIQITQRALKVSSSSRC